MTTTLTVDGMSCAHCEETVAEALGDVDGVTDVRVDRADDSATIEGDVDDDALVAAVDEAGYSAHV